MLNVGWQCALFFFFFARHVRRVYEVKDKSPRRNSLFFRVAASGVLVICFLCPCVSALLIWCSPTLPWSQKKIILAHTAGIIDLCFHVPNEKLKSQKTALNLSMNELCHPRRNIRALNGNLIRMNNRLMSTATSRHSIHNSEAFSWRVEGSIECWLDYRSVCTQIYVLFIRWPEPRSMIHSSRAVRCDVDTAISLLIKNK